MTIFGMEADYGIHWYSLVLLFVPLGQRLVMDLHTINVQKKEVNHKVHTAITGFLMLVISILVGAYEPSTWWKALVLSFSIFFLFFDYALNVLRGKRWYYIDIGAGDGIHSLTDGVYARLGILGTIFAKVWFTFLAISIYFLWSYTGW